MSKSVGTAQSHAIIQALATNVDWSILDGEKLQDEVIKKPKEAGQRFTEFLKNGCQFIYIGEMRKLQLDESFDLTTFPGLGMGWNYWRGPLDGDGKVGNEWIDSRAAVFTELNLAEMIFKTCLKEGEPSIKGFEKLRRLVVEETDFIRYDLKFFLTFWKDYQKYKENSMLEIFYRTQQKDYLDFMVPLCNPNGDCYVLYLYRDDNGKWCWSYRCLGIHWRSDSFSVGCASSPLGLDPLDK